MSDRGKRRQKISINDLQSNTESRCSSSSSPERVRGTIQARAIKAEVEVVGRRDKRWPREPAMTVNEAVS